MTALAQITAWLPAATGLISGPAGATLAVAWWRHRERTRAQTDETALTLVETQGKRIDALEGWVRDLQHRLSNAETEKTYLLALLKYCSEADRAQAVADVERRQREADDRRQARDCAAEVVDIKGDLRQAAQIARSARHVAADQARG